MLELVEYESFKYFKEIKNFLRRKKAYLFLDEEFINNLINNYKAKFYFILSFDINNKINGILFFYINENFKRKKIGYTFFDSFIFDEKKIAENIILEIENFISKNSISAFYINSTNNLDKILNDLKKNYIINIHPNNNNLNWDNKPGVFRTEVRKAIKRGFNIITNQNFPSIKYYNLYLANQLKKNIPIHNKKFFFELLKMKSTVIFSCEKEGVLAGYALIGLDNDKAHLLFSNISKENLSHGVNQLIFWEVIQFLSKKSINNLILGPSNPNGNTAFFKKKIGGIEFDFYQHHISLNKYKNNINSQNSNKKNKSIKSMIIKFLPKFILLYILKHKRIYGKIF